jgi:diphosphate-dependent phosphofructokinase
MHSLSTLAKLRLNFKPVLPQLFREMKDLITAQENSIRSAATSQNRLANELAAVFPLTYQLPILKFALGESEPQQPLRVGVVLSGGQAAGGHNVIAGLFDALTELHSNSILIGFLNGPAGIIDNHAIEITREKLSLYRNQGGFDLIGSGRTKIETEEQFKSAEKNIRALNLDGLVIVGGDDSNTNAAFLAEVFCKNGCKTKVVGVPKTIDGDLKNEYIETSFGFDSACKTYSEIIGNILRDSLSQKKYYFFIKLMGRSASHIALECALQTHPNMTLIGEEIAEKQQTLQDLVKIIADMICARAKEGKDYGAILIPEGIIEFIPECNLLIAELNTVLAADKLHQEKLDHLPSNKEKIGYIQSLLTSSSTASLQMMPETVQIQLLLDRDPHGNVQVSKIESDRLLLEMVSIELKKRRKAGDYSGKFSAQPLFLGYEGRSCLPTNFDAQYCYALGYAAAGLIAHGANGYMACIKGLTFPVEEWQALGIPLVNMMRMEQRKGKLKPVIQKALVNLQGEPFQAFAAEREDWLLADDYRYPGPIQFFGPAELTESRTDTLNRVTSVCTQKK